MRQATLFDCESQTKSAPIARASDPVTSRIAEADTMPKLNGLQSCCLVVLGRAIRPRTANEIAAECVTRYGKLSESYRKRLHELVSLGRAVECGERPCEITGKLAMTFKAKEADR